MTEPTDNSLQDGDLIPRPEKTWKPTPADPFPTFRCTKIIKSTGLQCKNGGITGMLPENAKCIDHGGKQMSVQDTARARVEVARMKVLNSTTVAADVLESLLETGTADNIRLKAATEILDRAGIKGAETIDINVEHSVNSADEVRKRIAKLALGKLDARLDEDDEDQGNGGTTLVEDDE